MTRAKPHHLQARALMIKHLDMHPGRVVASDLDPAEVGIIGSDAHKRTGTSYHIGKGDLILPKRPYSVYESERDRKGLDLFASAMDFGQFRVTTRKGTYDLPHFSLWLVRLCKASDPDTRDIREIIYSPDGRVVLRWDREKVRSSGDGSHRTHTHVSEYRDADGSRMLRLCRRYLIEIGLLAGEDDDMTISWNDSWRGPGGVREDAADRLAMAAHSARDALVEIKALKVAVTALAGSRPDADTGTILARMEALATEERDRDIAAARERAELAELVRRVDLGELDAAEVVRLIGERLTGETQSR